METHISERNADIAEVDQKIFLAKTNLDATTDRLADLKTQFRTLMSTGAAKDVLQSKLNVRFDDLDNCLSDESFIGKVVEHIGTDDESARVLRLGITRYCTETMDPISNQELHRVFLRLKEKEEEPPSSANVVESS